MLSNHVQEGYVEFFERLLGKLALSKWSHELHPMPLPTGNKTLFVKATD